MSDICKLCENMDLKDLKMGKAYCSYWDSYYDPEGLACGHYREGKGYYFREDKRDKQYNQAVFDDKHKDDACYLTTCIKEILGFPDDCEFLTKLRSFRDNYLLKNPKYFPLLLEYNVVGPRIAASLKQDPDKEDMAKFLLDNFIKEIIELIDNNKNEEAISRYQALVDEVLKYYGIEKENICYEAYVSEIPENPTKQDIRKLAFRLKEKTS